jgi:hypothetical protein
VPRKDRKKRCIKDSIKETNKMLKSEIKVSTKVAQNRLLDDILANNPGTK